MSERKEETDKEGYVRAVQTLALSPDWSVLQSQRDCWRAHTHLLYTVHDCVQPY